MIKLIRSSLFLTTWLSIGSPLHAQTKPVAERKQAFEAELARQQN